MGYLAFGDSITLGVGFDDCSCQCREDCGYPARLQEMLQEAGIDAMVTNAGIGGESTPEGLARIDTLLPGHEVLLLMEGSNDISLQISPETTVFNLDQMATRAERQGLSVVHATLIPRIPAATRDPDNDVNQLVAWGVRHLAYDTERLLADPFEVFGSVPDPFDTLYSDVPDDPVGHPNPAGFDVLAETFFNVLEERDQVPPVLGLVDPPDGSEGVPADAELVVQLFDFGEGIDISATDLLVDGRAVGASVEGDSGNLTLTFRPSEPLAGFVEVGYRSRDLATPPNSVERQVARLVIEGTTLLSADLDRDGRVDGADLVRLARAFGSGLGQARYDPVADLDSSGVVDGQDLAILASQFGESAI
ncbi:MAG TPA: GDSL-type esterase/lipase family protein [Thermoanaerobaculia bacterium]|nr:GDSL-type esterase/lipase family protein [Thermoanaerobaculia bacterium]